MNLKRDDVRELHYITAVENVSSIWRRGILSHRRAGRVRHVSVAMPEVQERRAGKIVPGGWPLHEYVNLYFHARNPMLYYLSSRYTDLCVLRVAPAVLDLPDVVIADRNASSDWAVFYPSPGGLSYLDEELVFAERWTHPGDQFREWEHKSIKCAEVLVPERVDPGYLMGVYVPDRRVRNVFRATGVPLLVEMNAHLFFR